MQRFFLKVSTSVAIGATVACGGDAVGPGVVVQAPSLAVGMTGCREVYTGTAVNTTFLGIVVPGTLTLTVGPRGDVRGTVAFGGRNAPLTGIRTSDSYTLEWSNPAPEGGTIFAILNFPAGPQPIGGMATRNDSRNSNSSWTVTLTRTFNTPSCTP